MAKQEKKLKDDEKLGNTSCYLMELHNIFHNIFNKLHICMLFLAFLYWKYSSHEHNFVNVFPFKSILFFKEFLSSQQN